MDEWQGIKNARRPDTDALLISIDVQMHLLPLLTHLLAAARTAAAHSAATAATAAP